LDSSPVVLHRQAGAWGTQVPSSQEERVWLPYEMSLSTVSDIFMLPGAAIDKVKALERAGAIVTDSPAKIGQQMMQVLRILSFNCIVHLLTIFYQGNEGGGSHVDS
jgi:hypothetical protein